MNPSVMLTLAIAVATAIKETRLIQTKITNGVLVHMTQP